MQELTDKIIKKLDLSKKRESNVNFFLETISYYKLLPYIDFIANNQIIMNKINQKIDGKDNWDAVVFLYRYNIKLSKAIYPYIYLLETTLKNKINHVLCKNFDNNWYKESSVLHKAGKQTVEYLLEKKCKYLNASVNPHVMDFIENYTTLGYWVAIVDSSNFWNSKEIQIRELFSMNKKLNPALVKQKKIIQQLRSIKDLRNAISHYNQIIGCRLARKGYSHFRLGDVYQNIIYLLTLLGCEDINWMIGDLDCCSNGSFESLYNEFGFIHDCDIKVEKTPKKDFKL